MSFFWSRAMRRLVFLAALAAVMTVPVSAARAQKKAPELKKLHVLLVIDSNSNLGKSVEKDEEMMVALLSKGIPKNRYDLKALKGADATPASIMDYYQHLEVGPDEGLLFYYTGHGVTLRKQHNLVLGYNPDQGKRGRFLKRDTVIAAMRNKEPALAILLTDCCSDEADTKGKEPTLGATLPEEVKEIRPILRNLFFEHRGIVDITAATLDKSLAFGNLGGLFTITTTELLSSDVPSFKPADPDFLTWAEFMAAQRELTNLYMKTYVEACRKNGKEPILEKQVALPYQLADGGTVSRPRWRFGAHVFDHDGNGVLVRRIFPGTPAERAGMEAGDVIVAIDSQPIRDEDDYARTIDGSEGKIRVQFRKGGAGETVTRDVKLDRIPDGH
jgi:hypothetical protein